MHQLPFQVHEAYVQKALGLSSTKGSGNQFHDPGDGVDHSHYADNDFSLIIDCKCTSKKSFSVKLEDLTTWQTKAWEMGKRFAMPIRFEKPGKAVDYILLSLNDFVELFEKARQM